MFDWLKEIFADAGTLVTPVVRVNPWQGAVILRYGRWHRTLEPGYYWKWPLFEDAVWAEACETTLRLPPQSITTSDDVMITVSCVVKYQIRDIRKFVCDVWDQKDVLADVAMGAISDVVDTKTYEQLMAGRAEFKRDVLERLRKGVNKYGFQVHQVTFPDLCRGRALRLILPGTKDLDN